MHFFPAIPAIVQIWKSGEHHRAEQVFTLVIVTTCAVGAAMPWYIVGGFSAAMAAFVLAFCVFAAMALVIRVPILRFGHDFALWFILMIPVMIEWLTMMLKWPDVFWLS